MELSSRRLKGAQSAVVQPGLNRFWLQRWYWRASAGGICVAKAGGEPLKQLVMDELRSMCLFVRRAGNSLSKAPKDATPWWKMGKLQPRPPRAFNERAVLASPMFGFDRWENLVAFSHTPHQLKWHLKSLGKYTKNSVCFVSALHPELLTTCCPGRVCPNPSSLGRFLPSSPTSSGWVSVFSTQSTPLLLSTPSSDLEQNSME